MILLASAIFASANASAAYVYTTNWFYSGNPVGGVRAIVYNCPNDGCTSLGTERFDETSGTNSITISYPVPAPNWGYATYWLSPGYRVMQDNWKPAGSGSSTANLNFQKYSSCSAPVNSISASSSVNEGQALSITVNVDSALPAPSHAPYARPADADLIRDYFSARTNVTILIRDASSNLVYTASSDNYILENDDRNFAFSWTPNYTQSGSYTITARTNVIDSKCSSATTVNSSPRSVTVNNAPNPDNHAPVLNAIGSKIVLNDTLLQFTVSGSDPDGDSLTYSASGLPSGASFNAGTRTFSWTPDYTQAGAYDVTFSVTDGELSDSEEITITVVNVNRAPVLDAIGNQNGVENVNLAFTISATDPDGDSVIYSATGMPYGATLNNATGAFSWTPNYTQSGVYPVTFTASDGTLSDSEAITITIADVDIEAPQYSDISVFPSSPATYASGHDYQFNITWTDNIAVSDVIFEFNGANYSTTDFGDVYVFEISDLAVENYTYRWFAQDASGNANETELYTYSVVKASTTTDVLVDPASPVTYGTVTNFSCSNSGNLAIVMLVNGVDATSEFGLSVLRAAGDYIIDCIAADNQNYTGSNATENFTIDKAYPVLKADWTSPITYGTASDYNAWEENANGDSDLTYDLYRNGELIVGGSSGNASDSEVLGAGTWEYNYTTAGGENYTAGEDVVYLIVNPATPNLTITAEPDSTVEQGTETNVSGLDCPSEISCELYRDGVLVANPNIETLGAGTYNYEFNTTGNENYTAANVNLTLVVTKTTPDLHLYIDGNEADKNVTYGTETNATVLSGTSDVELYRNGVLVSDENVETLAAGTYNYTAYALENANYTSASVTRWVVVDKAATSLDLQIAPGNSVAYGTETNATGSGCPSQLVCELTRDGVNADSENGVNITLPAGSYNYTYSTAGNENYTADLESEILAVSKISANCTIFSNSPVTYPNTVNVTASCDNPESALALFRDGTDVTGENALEVLLGAGTYEYVVNASESENYTFASASTTVVVNQGTPVMTYLLNSGTSNLTLSYGDTVNATAYSDVGTVNIFRNTADVTSENGLDVLLGAGTYVYEFNVTGNANYSDVASEFMQADIGKAAGAVSLVFDKASPQDYGTTINATCSIVSGDGTVILYRNGADVTSENGLDVLLGAGSWDYSCYMAETENYTADEDNQTFVINAIAPDLHLYINGNEADDSVVYGTETNASAMSSTSDVELYRNGVLASDENIETLAAGEYNYTAVAVASQNYSSASLSFNLTVTQATPVLSIGFAPSNNESEGTETNVTGSGCDSQLACTLARDGTPVSNPDVSTLAAGTYNYTYSTAGNENYTAAETSDLLNIYDNSAPQLEFVAPTPADSTLQGSDSIAVNVSALDSHLANVTIELHDDSGLVNSTTSTDNPYFVEFTGLSDGAYYINATALDESGNSNSTETRTITVDTTAPLVEFVDPTTVDGAHFNQFEANVSATDSHLANITINAYNETGLWASVDSATSPFHYRWNSVPDGLYSFNATACDSLGNCNSTETRTIEKDTIPPAIEFVAPTPANNTLTASNDLEINVSVSDVHSVTTNITVFNDDGSIYDSALAEYALFSDMPDGVYYYNATAEDSFYRVNATETRMITIDASAPLIEFVNPTRLEGRYVIDTFEFNATASDMTLANITFNVYDDSGWQDSFTCTESPCYTTFVFGQGNNYVNATAFDMLGNSNSTETRNYSVDTIRPEIDFVSPTPANGSMVDSDQVINITASDAHLDTISVYLYDSGMNELSSLSSPNSPFEVLLDVSALGDGTYFYNASVSDTWGWSNHTELRTIIVDTAAPVISFEDPTPADSAYLDDSGFSVNATATDDYLANLTVYLYSGSTLLNATTVTSGENFVEFDGLADGVYQINATALDTLGHESSTETRTITVDGNAPLVDFVSPTPANATLTNQNFRINVTASDYHVSRIDIVVYDENLADVHSVTKDDTFGDIFDYSVLESLSDGVYYYNGSATDSVGHVNATELRMITVDKTAPSVEDISIVPASIWNTQSVTISANVTDLHGVSSVTAMVEMPDASVENITLSESAGLYSGVYSNTAQNGTYTVTIYALDSLGNKNETESASFDVNYSVVSVVNSWIYGTFYPSNFTWEILETTVENSTVTDSTVSGTPIVNITHSTLENSTLTDVTIINYCTVLDSTVIGGTCDHAYIDPSTIINSNTTGSTIINSNINDSNATYSYIENSDLNASDVNNSIIINGIVDNSDVFDSNVTDSTVANSSVSNSSAVNDSELHDSTVENSTVIGSNLSNSNATNSIIENTDVSDSEFTDCNITDGNVTNMTENATFTFNGTTVDVTEPLGIEYFVNFGPSVSWTGLPHDVKSYIGEEITPVNLVVSDPNIVNGTSIALTFNDSLTYSYYITDLDSGDEFVQNSLVISEVGDYRIYLKVSDAFGLYNVTTSDTVKVEQRPRESSGGGGGACTTQWICTNWTDCANGTMTRNCTKQRPGCDINEAMPEVVMSCVSPTNSTNQTSEGDETDDGKGIGAKITSKITGAVVGASGMAKGAMIFVAIIAAAAILMWLIRKNPAVLKKRKLARKR